MSLPKPVETLWNELQAVRVDVLREAEGLTQRQADWKPSATDWSVGEIVDHLTIAEIATGKLTTKLTKEAAAAGTLAQWPADLTAFATLPPAQWWQLQIRHDRIHLAQVRDVRRAPGFPKV